MKSFTNSLTVRLKKQNRDLKNELKVVKDQISRLKKSVKYTNIQDLKTDAMIFEGEAIRLKNILNNTIKEKVEKV